VAKYEYHEKGGERGKEEGKRNYLSTDDVSRVTQAKHLVLFSLCPYLTKTSHSILQSWKSQEELQRSLDVVTWRVNQSPGKLFKMCTLSPKPFSLLGSK
jgi:hypothetical protein